MMGAGSFAQNYLLPNLPPNSNLLGVCTAGGVTASNVAKKYGFNYATSNDEKLFSDPLLNTVFVATRHNLHFEFVKKQLREAKMYLLKSPFAYQLKSLRLFTTCI
ncbi:MAG: Gfo/Idh/MocA family oxidoreductase [Ignavibacteriales bacterium]|nr:Gfo/Idh/MocA family oxidoreductase [Ignavibacteriales bacterium]